jgi:hypothetical protein
LKALRDISADEALVYGSIAPDFVPAEDDDYHVQERLSRHRRQESEFEAVSNSLSAIFLFSFKTF